MEGMAAAGGAAVGSVIQGGFSLGQQAMANSSNQDVAAMNNSANQKMQQVQNDFTNQFFDKGVGLFEKEGLPGYLAVGSGSGGGMAAYQPRFSQQVAGNSFSTSLLPGNMMQAFSLNQMNQAVGRSNYATANRQQPSDSTNFSHNFGSRNNSTTQTGDSSRGPFDRTITPSGGLNSGASTSSAGATA